MRHRGALAGLALTIGIGACAPMPAPAPVAAVPTIERAAYGGIRQRLDFLTTLRPDCSYMGSSSYHFIVRPQHGIVDFKPAEEPPAYLQTSIYYKCNEHRVHGVTLSYTADRGYDGSDRFVMEWISPAGLLYRRQYEVTVR